MRTAGFWPPLMLTNPTPGNCEIFWESVVSARSSTLVSGMVLEAKRQRQNGRVCRVHFAIDGRIR